MKNTITFLLLLGIILTGNAQEEKLNDTATFTKLRCGTTINNAEKLLYVLDRRPIDKTALADIAPNDIISFSVLNGNNATSLYGVSLMNVVVLIQTNKNKPVKCNTETFPFKVYCIENTDWVLHQDIYNTLEARVPSLRVGNKNTTSLTPAFNIRGDDDTLVIVDGVWFDASILNTINPNDIESIKVAPSATATNYFRNGMLNQ